MKKNYGFSLIELLISIAIIGILGSIILSSVSQSRSRAYDSKIKQQLSSFRTAAEIYYHNNGSSYGPDSGGCNSGIFSNMDAANGTPGIYIADGNLPEFSTPACQSSASAYAVKASLYSGTDYWCVDSKGASMRVSDGAPALICI